MTNKASIAYRLLSCFRLRGLQRGATLVEYAFVVIGFLTLIFGISGFGHALFAYHFVNEAAKEASRYASVRGSTCSGDSSCVATNSASSTAGPTSQADLTAYVKSIAPQSIDPNNLTITATWPGPSSPPICTSAVNGVGPWPSNSPGCTVKVQVQYTYNFIFPLIKTSPVNMSSISEMVIVH